MDDNLKKNNSDDFVACDYCERRSDIWRMENICERCNNSKIVKNPKYVICNQCGGPARSKDQHYNQEILGIEMSIRGGYSSYHLFDLTHYSFVICEKCVRHLFNNFKIPPTVTDMDFDPDDPCSYEKDKEAYEYRLWKDNGGFTQAYMKGLCNSIKDCPNKAIYSIFNYSEFSEACSCEEHKELHFYGGDKLEPFVPYNLKPFI